MTGIGITEKKGVRSVSTSDFQKLRECPFCGDEAFVRIDIMLNPMQSRYRVGCDKNSNCSGWYGHSRYYDTEAEAIAAWNTRAERTCKLGGEVSAFGVTLNMLADIPWYWCLECGAATPSISNYCMHCGAKVVGE